MLQTLFLILFFPFFILADEFAPEGPLEKHYPLVLDSTEGQFPVRSPIQKVIDNQTSVKSQGSRGTCTIFTSIGLLESRLIEIGAATKDIDLSEEWLEYVIMTKKTDEGSTTSRNFKKLRFWGVPGEDVWPYDRSKWAKNPESDLVNQWCGHLREIDEGFFQSCLYGNV